MRKFVNILLLCPIYLILYQKVVINDLLLYVKVFIKKSWGFTVIASKNYFKRMQKVLININFLDNQQKII